MRTKRFLSLTLAAIMAFSTMFYDTSFASELEANTSYEKTADADLKWQDTISGTFGDDLTWEIGPSSSQEEETRKLTITGTGAMPDYTKYSTPPWKPYASAIKCVEIGGGITTVGAYSFYDENVSYNSFSKIILGEGVTTVKQHAFDTCFWTQELVVPSTLTAVETDAFEGIPTIRVDSLEHWFNIDFANEDANPIFDCNSGGDQYLAKFYIGDAEDYLHEMTIPASVTTIKPYTLGGFMSVRIPTTVKKFERNSAYCSCVQLIFEGPADNYSFESGWDAARYKDAAYIFTDPAYSASWDSLKTTCRYYNWSEGTPYNLETFIAARNSNILILEKGNLLHIFKDDSDSVYINVSFRNARKIVVHEGIKAIGTNGIGMDTQYLHLEPAASAEEIELPQSLITIKNGAFKNIQNLKSITIPRNVTTIGSEAFQNAKIEEIIFENDSEAIGVSIAEDALKDCGNVKIYYEKESGWNSYTTSNYGAESVEWLPVETEGEHRYYYTFDDNGTCCSNATETGTCIICKEATKVREIPDSKVSTKHTYTVPYIVPATDTTDGHSGLECEECHEKAAETTKIAKIKSVAVMPEKCEFENVSQLKITVLDDDDEIIPATQYDVVYSATDKVGGGVATITFKEKYAGTIKAAYFIVPSDSLEITASATDSSVKLSWNAVRGINSYLVEREVSGNDESSERTVLSCVSGNEYEDTTVVSGTDYKYTVSNVYDIVDDKPQTIGSAAINIHFEKSGEQEDPGNPNPPSPGEEIFYSASFYDRDECVNSIVVKAGDTIDFTQIQDPVRDGYEFLGWFLDELKIDSSYVVTDSIILIAKWELANKDDISGNDEHTHSFVETINEDGTITVTCKGCDYYREITWGDVSREDAESQGYTVKTIPSGFWVSGISDAQYSAKGITFPNIHVYKNKKKLVLNTDYSIKYSNNINMASATSSKAPTVTITFKGNYSGEIVRKFNIVQLDISGNSDFTVDPVIVTYNGEVQRKTPVLKWKGKALTLNKDYRVIFKTDNPDYYRLVNEDGYDITLVGMGRFSGEIIAKEIITDRKLISSVTIGKVPDQKYNSGEKVEPELSVTFGTALKLVENTDYTVTYTNNINIGTATATIHGINGYYGDKSISFKIVGTNISKGRVLNFASSVTYTGGAIEQPNLVLQIKVGNNYVDVPKEKYTVKYTNNIKAGKATVEFTGKEEYSGTLKKTFTINGYDLSKDFDNLISVDYDSCVTFSKKGAKPAATVKFYDVNTGSDVILKLGTDYTVSYKNNTGVNDGTNPKKVPTIVIAGKGNFKGTRAKEFFTIEAKDIGLSNISTADKVTNSKAGNYRAIPVLVDTDDGVLKADTDFGKADIVYFYGQDVEGVKHTVGKKFEIFDVHKGEVIAKNAIVPTGTLVNMEIHGKGNYYGTISDSFRVIAAKEDISKAKVYISDKIYTGEKIEPGKSDITVVLNGITLADTDYIITGYSKNVSAGKASVSLKGIGNYGGVKNFTFVIAKCTSYFNVSFHANGGIGTMKTKNSKTENFILPKLGYSKKGYQFMGWNTKADGSGEAYIGSYTGTENVVELYAQWQIIHYKLNYVISQDVDNQENPTTYTIESDTITLTNPTRKYYDFKGWYKDSKFKSKISSIAAGTIGNLDLYPKWEAKKYSILYYVNDGVHNDCYYQSISYGSREKLFTGSVVTRKDFNLESWNTRSNGKGTSYAPGQEVYNLVEEEGGQLVLYAQWHFKGYELGETWTVAGNYSVRIDKVEVHYACNRYRDANAVVLVTYTYKNINWTSISGLGLYLSSSDIKIFDDNNVAGGTYPCTHDTSPTRVSPGYSCTATQAFSLNKESKFITLEVSESYSYTSPKRRDPAPKAKFFIPLVKGNMHNLADDLMEIGTFQDGKYVYENYLGVKITYDTTAGTVKYYYGSEGERVNTEVYFIYDLNTESFGNGLYANIAMYDESAYVRGWATNFGYGYYYDMPLHWKGEKKGGYNEDQLDTYAEMAILSLSGVVYEYYGDTIERYGFIIQ